MNKTSLIALGLSASVFTGSASASLLIGLHEFSHGIDKQIAGTGSNYVASGFSGDLNPSRGTNKSAVGGSTDLTYGSQTFAASTPGTNNGYVTLFDGWKQVLTLTNNSGRSVILQNLLFDAATTDKTPLAIGYHFGSAEGGFTSLNNKTLTTSFENFVVSLNGLSLDHGQTIQFEFAGPMGGQLDNIGVTGLSAIPEPGSLVALGSLIGMGAFIRNRRRSGIVALG